MAVEFLISADGIGASYVSSGVLTGQDLLNADAKLQQYALGNPAFRYLLIDHSAIPEERVDAESLRTLASRSHRIMKLLAEGIVAIVAPNDALFGISRMWEMQAEQIGLSVEIVKTRDEAIARLEQQLAARDLPFRLSD